MQVLESKKFFELESLRGIAALLVFLNHIPNWFGPFYQNSFIRNGGIMVEFFFVLSGFVIFTAYGNRIVHVTDIARFQVLRLGRLYPIHLTFLMLFVFFEFLKVVFISDPISSPFTRGISGPREFLENLALVQALGFSNKPDSFNAPSWSISTEFYTYLIFAFLAMSLARRQYIAHLAIVFSLIILLTLDLEELSNFTRLMSCIAGFFFGCLICNLSLTLKEREIALPHGLALISLLLLALFLFGGLRGGGIDSVIIYLLSGMIILGLVSGPDNPLRRFLRRIKLLGQYSYTIYMSHWAVIYVADVLLKRWSSSPSSDNTINLALDEFCITLIFVSMAVAIISWVSHKLIEKPFRAMSRTYVARKFN